MTVAISKGVDPSAKGKTAPGYRPRRGNTPVTAVGGTLTPEMRSMAEHWAESNRPRDWARTTGSSDAAIAWALDPDR